MMNMWFLLIVSFCQTLLFHSAVTAQGLPPCQFPFIYKSNTYFECTTIDDPDGNFWCSTETDDQNNHMKDQYRSCVQDDVVTDKHSSSSPSYCQFPFIFEGVRYSACTSVKDPDGELWCSTETDSQNNHVKDRWRYCKPPSLDCGSYEEASQSLTTTVFLEERIRNNPDPLEQLGGTASLHTSTSDLGPGTHKCGASLITNRHLITAAHCVTRGDKISSVSLGREDLNVYDSTGTNKYEILDIITHPGYKSGNYDYNDIAIIVTKRDVKYGPSIWPYCLPDKNLQLDDHDSVEIAGWGQVNQYRVPSSVLKTANINIIKNDRCESIWRSEAPGIYDNTRKNSYPQGLDITLLCAGKRGIDPCNGDSGGPMSYKNSKGQQTVVGVISKGISTCPIFPITPGFFVNIPAYVDWIYETIGITKQPTHFNQLQLGSSGLIGVPPDLNCPFPWFRLEDQCFLLVKKWSNWTSAHADCSDQAPGGVLARPSNLQPLGDYIKTNGYSESWHTFWLGGFEFVSEGNWRWLDGSSIATGWKQGEPNNDGDGSEGCLGMEPAQGANSLNDMGCERNWPSVCERS